MNKGYQVFVWSDEDNEYIGGETFRDPMMLAMACYKLGMLRQEVEIRRVGNELKRT